MVHCIVKAIQHSNIHSTWSCFTLFCLKG